MRDGKMKKAAGDKTLHRVAVMVATAVLVPSFAFAVETDRVTVEDPATGTVMFRVTSGGNVTGTSFNGDGSGLTNVTHWKGTWSGVASYSKDDVVAYGGSSYIALKPTIGAQPNQDVSSWSLLAQQGPAGAIGPIGPQGPAGPAGSSDNQVQIISKIATPADGVVLALQQGNTEASTAVKLSVTDKGGVSKFSVSPQVVRIGDVNAATPPVEISGGVAGSDMITFKRTVGTNLTFGLSLGGGGITFSNRTAGTSNLFLTTYSGVPTAVIGIDNYAGAGRDAWIRPGGANINSTTNAAGSSLILSSAPQTGTGVRGEVRFQTYPVGTSGTQWTTPVTRVKIKPDGELELYNGLKFSTTVGKPTCDINARGTFWVTQGDTDDVVEVCKKVAGLFVWKVLE